MTLCYQFLSKYISVILTVAEGYFYGYQNTEAHDHIIDIYI